MTDDLQFEFRHGVHSKNIQWEKQFGSLKDFKAVSGHCNVPSRNNRLFKWVKHQHQMYQSLENGENLALTREQLERFGLIGVEWAATKKTEKHGGHAQYCISKGYGNGAGDSNSSHIGKKRKSAEESD